MRCCRVPPGADHERPKPWLREAGWGARFRGMVLVRIMRPLVTIGLPAHNAALYLPLALGSILAQTLHDWELIAVDDGSTDETLSILRAVSDPRIRVIAGEKRLGLSARLNQIAREARGEFLARMDADDLMHPSRLEKQLAALNEQPQLDGIGCGLVVLDRHLRPVGVRQMPEMHEQICAQPLRGIKLVHATFVARTQWFRSHPYNEANFSCEDWELWLHTYGSSRFGNLALPLYYYREFDSFSLPQYIQAKLWIAKLQWQSRESAGLVPAVWTSMLQCARAATYMAAYPLGLCDWIISRRSEPLDGVSTSLFYKALPSIFEYAERVAKHSGSAASFMRDWARTDLYDAMARTLPRRRGRRPAARRGGRE